MEHLVTSFTRKGSLEKNEDDILYKNINSDTALFILADGMGGLSKGKEAASIILNEIYDYIYKNIKNENKIKIIRESIKKANEIIYENCKIKHCRMGAAVSVLLCCKKIAYFSWLGDVRIYKLRESKLIRLTNDHILDKSHSILTRSVNGRIFEKITPCEKTSIKAGDCFILCSDGFYNEITENDLLHYNINQISNNIVSPKDDSSVITITFK